MAGLYGIQRIKKQPKPLTPIRYKKNTLSGMKWDEVG